MRIPPPIESTKTSTKNRLPASNVGQASLSYPTAGCGLRLSVVVCSYNQASFIRQTLESLLNQQYLRPRELEIIVIDGGSTDGSFDIITEYAAHLSYLVSERDRGQTDALRKGFAHATGDILGWLCSDDILNLDAPRFVLDYFSEHPDIEFIYGDAHIIGPDGELLKIRKEIPFNWFIWKYDYNYIPQASAFWRRNLYDQVGGLDEGFELCMDGDLWARFAEVTRPRHVRRFLSKPRWYAQCKTQRYSKQAADEHAKVCQRYGTNLAATPQVLRVLAKCFRISWKLVTGCYLNY